MSSLIVQVVKIEALEPHPNADRLELAQIAGWTCIVPKGRFSQGSSCVYIPIDSILPQALEEKIFPIGSKVVLHNHRVKTIKLRGAISQGLIVDLETCAAEHDSISTDLTERLGIKKYEPPVNGSPQCKGKTATPKRPNPNFHKYTDIENLKNFVDLFKSGEEVVVTEKIHGSNTRAGIVQAHAFYWWQRVLRFFKLLPKYEFVYGSHNVQLQSKVFYRGFYPKNVYWEMVKRYRLNELLKPEEMIYGECYGDGIQKGYLYDCGAGERKLVVFDIKIGNRYLDYDEYKQICVERGLPMVPELYRGPFDLELIKHFVTGDSVLHPGQKVREGVVVRPVKEQLCYAGRKVLKLISDEYLLRDNTEFH